MHKPTIIALLSLTLLCCTLPLRAWNPIQRNFSPQESNSGTQNWCIAELPDGRMLFGNNNGLLLYDGDAWGLLNMPDYTAVRSVFYDSAEGRIYVGASNDFGYFTVSDSGSKMEYHSLSPFLSEKEVMFGEVWGIHSLDGQIVFQSKKQLMIYSPEAQRITIIVSTADIDCSAVIDGRLYVASAAGISVLSGTTLTPLTGTERVSGLTIRTLLPHPDGILLATIDSGLWLYNGREARPFAEDLTPFLRSNLVFCATLQGDTLVVGTVRKGVVVRDLKSGETIYANTSTGLANNTVLSVALDGAGNVWAGLDKGIAYLLTNAPYGTLLGRSTDIGTGYASATFAGHLFLGTNQGLFAIPLPSTATPFSSYTAGAPSATLVAGMSGQVWSLYEHDGKLLCAADRGAYLINVIGGKPVAEKIDLLTGSWNFRAVPSADNLVLACDYDGFCLLERKGNGYTLIGRLDDIDINSGNFEFDKDGSLWVAHWRKGVYRYVLSDDKMRVTHREFFGKDKGLYVDSENRVAKIGGRVAVVSVDGIHVFDSAKKTLAVDTLLSSVFARYGRGYQLYETSDSVIWAMSGDFFGVARRTKQGTWQVDTTSFNGIRLQLQTNLGLISAIDDNHTLLNGIDGFWLSKNSGYGEGTRRRSVMIRRISSAVGDSVLYVHHSTDSAMTISVPHELNSLRIEFVMPEYRAAGAVRYQYWLEGYDSGWSSPQQLTSKEYTKLGRGRYVFHVKATDTLDGSIGECRIEIEILPAWYETWWAFIIYILLAATAVTIAVRCIRKTARQQLLRERRENERRIAEQEALFNIEREKKEKEIVSLRNRQLEQELKLKANEIADTTMTIIRKNDILKDIDDQLTVLSDNIRRNGQTDALRQINGILRDIRRQRDSDETNWDTFAHNFNLVHNHFLDKLSARCPQLKTSDLKICAYLRMGLSSKEIASLMNTATRSVETARYRLRKKLEVPPQDNLHSFLQQIENGEMP